MSAAAHLITATELPLPLYARGKVRDIYRLGPAGSSDASWLDDRLLMVATDRLSAFDHVLPTPIPDKGQVLTRLSAFWFAETRHIVPNHFLSLDLPAARSPSEARALQALRGRAMVVRQARRVDVECVVRGYLAGSAWEEYQSAGTVAGLPVSAGMAMGVPFPEPIFTPATKAATGHDENITFEHLEAIVGGDLARRLRTTSVELYRFAHAHAERCGLILADTKFEFGLLPDGTLLLIDEALTPDSSRYWDARAHHEGRYVPFDKQFVRDYLMHINWNREPPAPALPPDIVAATAERYREVYRRLVGVPLPQEVED